MWILERQGTEYNDKREFDSKEEAQEVMEKEYEEVIDNGYNDKRDYDCDSAAIGDHEYFQAWDIYKKKENLSEIENAFNEIELQINRIYNGVEQYSWELIDTGVITGYVDYLQKMIDELKELI